MSFRGLKDCVKSVPRCHFKVANVILQMAVKEFTSKNGNTGHFNLQSHF